MGSITHKPKTGALLTGTEYEAADAHTVTLTASDVGAAATAHVHSGADITSGTVADGNIAATIARDSEVTTAVSNHAAAADPHTGYLQESDFTTIDFLVGTATALTGAEIVVGTTPGGELGGTWASPTVDATHSGSSHAGVITAHEAAGDPHPVYLTQAEGDAAYQPIDSDLTAIAALTTTAFGRALLTLADAAAMLSTSGALASADYRQWDETDDLRVHNDMLLPGTSELFFASPVDMNLESAYAPDSMSIPNGFFRLHYQELILDGSNEASLLGTGELVIFDWGPRDLVVA